MFKYSQVARRRENLQNVLGGGCEQHRYKLTEKSLASAVFLFKFYFHPHLRILFLTDL